MSAVNKILVCLFCSSPSCMLACCYNCWAANQACCKSCVYCYGCEWTIFAPICHTLKLGDISKGIDMCIKGVKHCIYGCLTACVSPCDGCMNCLLYTKKNFKDGVSGISDITQNTKYLAKKIEKALEISVSNEPGSSFKTYTP